MRFVIFNKQKCVIKHFAYSCVKQNTFGINKIIHFKKYNKILLITKNLQKLKTKDKNQFLF